MLTSRDRTLKASERKWLLYLADMLVILLAIGGSFYYWIYKSERLWDWDLAIRQLPWAGGIVIGWSIWMFITDLYDLKAATRWPRAIQSIITGGAIAGIIYSLYYFIAIPGKFDLDRHAFALRLAPMLAIASTTVLLSLWRWFYATFWGNTVRQRVLIYGAGTAGQLLARAIPSHPQYQAIGFIDDDLNLTNKVCEGLPTIGDRHDLIANRDCYDADEIVLAISKPIDRELLKLLTDCNERGITVSPMPLLYERLTGKVAIDHIGSQWYSALPFERGAFATFNRIGKRLLDLGCGLIIGTILLIVFPFVSLAIRLDSPGAVFYKQERVGRYGQKFFVYKFRSMVQNAERNGQAQWAVKGDARITKVGKFIRKTRLDELPQVLNVLRGQMSMVGPRPERQQFIQDLEQQIPFYRTRLAAKPGLTGWAQINYGYGSTIEDAMIKLQYDLYYLKHWSPWLDLRILLRTFAVVLKMQGQ